MSDTLRKPPALATPLITHVVGSRVLVYEEIGSTNDRALRLGGDGTVIVADAQTAGRGRHGRSWHSAPGLGLWFSVVFEKATPGLAFAAPLAVRDALAPHVRATIKWPNDVLIGGKKVCGVLVENRLGRTVVGIGINVHHQMDDFPPELQDRATSIERACRVSIDRGVLLREVLTRLDERVMVIRSGGFQRVYEEWTEACGIVGKRIHCGALVGIVNSVDRDGALVVATHLGQQRILLGEVVELEDA